MKKALLFFSAFVILTAALPFTAAAAENEIWIRGTMVTEDNAADVLGNGTVSYSEEDKTLTLNGADIVCALSEDGIYCGILLDCTDEITINIKNNSSITSSAAAETSLGIYSTGSIVITGNELKIELTNTEKAFGIFSEKNLTFYNGNVICDVSSIAFNSVAAYARDDLTMDGSSLQLYGTRAAAAAGTSLSYKNGTFFAGDVEATESYPAYSYIITERKPDPPQDGGEEGGEESGEEKTPDTPAPIDEKEKQVINTDTDKQDVAGSSFRPLMLKATAKKRTITLTWKKVKGADGYIIYGARCGKKLKKLKTVKAKTLKTSFKKLKKGKYYKYVAVAYKNGKNGKEALATSKSVHCTTDGGKKGNPTGIKLSRTGYTVYAGAFIKPAPVLKKKGKVATHIAKFRYESTSPDTVSVNKKGRIFAKRRGTAYVYIIAQNGMYKRVKITVE